MDIQKAHKAIKIAAMCGGFQAFFIAVSVTIVLIFNIYFLGLTPLAYIDAIIFAALAYGVYKKSRTFAVILLIYFLFGQLILIINTQSIAGIPWTLVFGYLYIQGIRGTFIHHRQIDHKLEKSNRNFSILGLMSFVIGCALSLLTIISITVTIVIPSFEKGVDIFSTMMTFGFFLHVIGTGLGIGGIIQKNLKQKLTYWGLGINSVFLLLYMVIIFA